jgi:hypothetical protein
MTSHDPRSERPRPSVPDTDAMAVDSLPDEVRLHSDPDETDRSQPSMGGPKPDSADSSADERSDKD